MTTPALPVPGDTLGTWGTVLNQFLSVSLNPDGTLKITPFSNPMTSLGDLIVGGANGNAVRLPVGSNGLFLGVVSGQPTWAQVPSGFSNPMSSVGDIIIGAGGGVASRLPVGGSGQVLGVVSGSPAWVTNPAGFANPMTSVGDLIAGGTAGAAQRLALGANGQVLGVTAGAIGWVTNPAGFANPMTAAGDMISGAGAGVPQRVAAGTNGQILTVVAGQPHWSNLPLVYLQPSGDVTGATDTSNIQSANNAFVTAGTGGTIYLGPGQWYVTNVTLSQYFNPVVSLIGSRNATFINALATGACILATGQNNPSGGFGTTIPVTGPSGCVRDIRIIGSSAPANAIGLQVGDVTNFDVDVYIENFSAAGCIGFRAYNATHYTERSRFKVFAFFNTQNVVLDANIPAGANRSFEFNEFDITLLMANFHAANDNDGLVMNNGAYIRGGKLRMSGNSDTQGTSPTNALFRIQGSDGAGNFSHIEGCELNIGVETDSSRNFGAQTINFGSGSNYIHNCWGQLGIYDTPWNPSNAVSGQVSFAGIINIPGDPTLVGNITLPAQFNG